MWPCITSDFCLFQNDAESLPFPNEECDFNLPDEIFEPPGVCEKTGSDYNDDGKWSQAISGRKG